MRASWKPSSTHRLATVVIAAVLLAVGCSADPAGDQATDSVVGVVSQVTGNGQIESFVVVDDGGASHAFRPAEGLTSDGEPLDRLRQRLVDRDRIAVRYEISADGAPIAVQITYLDG